MDENIFLTRMFARRSVICFFVAALLFMTCILRVAVIATGNYGEAQTKQSSYRIPAARVRGTVYDCNMFPLTNNENVTVAAVSPTQRAIVGISSMLEKDKLMSVLETLKSGKPAVCEVEEEKTCEGIAFSKVYKTAEDDSGVAHIIGYTDSSGHGVCGIEAAYDGLLYCDDTFDAVFTIDGRGNVLGGVEPYFDKHLSGISNAVVTTLDVNIQHTVWSALQNTVKGAAVVCDAETGKIRAMVSKPSYSLSTLSEDINNVNSPLINRALSAYNVGSVFKPCVAAAALESGKGDFVYNCTGSTLIVDRKFNCHKRDGHGEVNLCKALAYSCNSFFYNFAFFTGADKIYGVANSLNFGSPLKIADNIYSAKGSMPQRGSLDNPAYLANLSIGQGELLLSPVAILPLYCAIAGDGSYHIPSVVEKTIKDGKVYNYDIGAPTRVMSEHTAQILREYLQTVISEGTGEAAMPKQVSAGGKTATAQTGRYKENGTEITNSWFCGFFPAEAPRYVCVVMAEDGAGTASAFADIADGITKLSAVRNEE